MTKRILVVFCFLSGGVVCLLGLRDGSVKPAASARPSLPPSTVTPAAAVSVAAPAAAPSVLPHAALSAHGLIQRLAEEIGSPDVDFAARDRALHLALSQMTAQNLQEIGSEIAQGRMTGDQARAALYLFSLAGPQAAAALREIALGNGATATSEVGKRFALSLRVDALEQLENLASASQEARQAILEASTQIESRSLRELARIASLGIQQGNPGKLHRLMEETLKKNGG